MRERESDSKAMLMSEKIYLASGTRDSSLKPKTRRRPTLPHLLGLARLNGGRGRGARDAARGGRAPGPRLLLLEVGQ